MKPSVTIIADASMCPKTGAGGWAAWMIGNGLPSATFGGPLREKAHTSGEAELMALANALHIGASKGYARPGTVVMLQSDSLDALGYIRHGVRQVTDRPHPTGLAVPRKHHRPRHQAGRKAVEVIAKLARENQLVVAVRHVKGHVEAPGRHWVNGACDTIAKQHMRAVRDSIEKRPADAIEACASL